MRRHVDAVQTDAPAKMVDHVLVIAVQLPLREPLTANGRTVLLPDLSEVYVVDLAGGVAVPSAVATLGKLAEVAYAEPDWILTCSASPNDSLYTSQWALEKIKAPTAWSLSTGSRSVKVGIVDSGTDYVHRDLGHGFGPGFKVVGGYDYYNGDGNPMDDVSGMYDSHGTLSSSV